MKKSILFSVSTSFQLLVAVQIKDKYFKNDNVDIIITDYTLDYIDIAKRLQKTGLFRNVYTIQVRDLLYEKNYYKKFIQYLYATFLPTYIIKRKIDVINQYYDKLLFFNINLYTQCLYEILQRNNKNIMCERFEEGFNIYLKNDLNVSYVIRFKKMLGKKIITGKINTTYLFHPELLQYNMSSIIKEIPLFEKDNTNIIDKLNYVFNYKNEDIIRDSEVFYFEGKFYSENELFDDIDILDKIAQKIDKSKICIKLHPRSLNNRFKSRKYNVSFNNSIPWELVQMNYDFTGKIFITVSSASILASNLYFSEQIKSIFLFECIENLPKDVDYIFKNYIKDIKEKFNASDIIIPKSTTQLLDEFVTTFN